MSRRFFIVGVFIFGCGLLHAQSVQWKSLGGPKKVDGSFQAIRKITAVSQGSLLVLGAGLYRSDDKGDSWSKLSNARDYDFDKDSVMFAAGDDGVFSSTNFGLSWKNLNDQLPSGPFNNIVVTPAGSLVTCRNYDLYRSIDRGVTWDRVGDNIPIASGQMQMAVTPKGAIIVNFNYQSYRSTDDGQTWKAVSSEQSQFTVVRPTVLLSTSTEGHLARSTNDGLSWKDMAIPGMADYAFGQPTVDRAGKVYVGSSHFSGNGILIVSRDSGLTWVQLGTCPEVWCLAVDANFELYAGTYRTGIARTLKPVSSVATGEQPSSKLLLFPNPAGDWIRLSGGLKDVGAQVSIFDLVGREVFRSAFEEKVDISSLPNGRYLLCVQSGIEVFRELFEVRH